MKTAIFVDVQNIYYTTKDYFNKSFNYRYFWNHISSKDEIVKAYAYAIDKKDDKQQKFQYALESIGFDVKLKPYILRSDGTSKGDWDVGITIDILEIARKVEKIILLSGDGDFDILLSKLKYKYNCHTEVYGVEKLSSATLINSASKFYAIADEFLI